MFWNYDTYTVVVNLKLTYNPMNKQPLTTKRFFRNNEHMPVEANGDEANWTLLMGNGIEVFIATKSRQDDNWKISVVLRLSQCVSG